MEEIKMSLPNVKDRAIYIDGEITMASSTGCLKDLNKILDEDIEATRSISSAMGVFGVDVEKLSMPPIKVYINTPGGCAYSGLAMYDTLDGYVRSGGTIHAHAVGMCASAGILPFLSGVHRTCGRNASFMIHCVSGVAWGHLKNMKEDVKEAERLQKRYWGIIKQHTKITDTDLKKIYDMKKDWWIGAERAKQLGIVHEII